MSAWSTTVGNEPPIKTRFRRYECKYLISEDQAVAIRAYAEPFIAPDPYTAESPDHGYDITSLYLDSPDLRLFRESEGGNLDRIKLRIRSYDQAGCGPVFLEIKRRCNGLVLKGRARVTRDLMAAVLAGGTLDTSLLSPEEKKCCSEFSGWVARWLAQPVVWVKYRREAYVGSLHDDVRITMDRRLVCADSLGRSGLSRDSDWCPMESRQVVLELKFDDSFPDWMAQLVQRFRLEKRSYSKYGIAVLRGLDPCLLSPVDAWSLPNI